MGICIIYFWESKIFFDGRLKQIISLGQMFFRHRRFHHNLCSYSFHMFHRSSHCNPWCYIHQSLFQYLCTQGTPFIIVPRLSTIEGWKCLKVLLRDAFIEFPTFSSYLSLSDISYTCIGRKLHSVVQWYMYISIQRMQNRLGNLSLRNGKLFNINIRFR